MLDCQRKERSEAGTGSYAECLCDAGCDRASAHSRRLCGGAPAFICTGSQRCYLWVCQCVSEDLSVRESVRHDRTGTESLYQLAGLWEDRHGNRDSGCGDQPGAGSALYLRLPYGGPGRRSGNGYRPVLFCRLGAALFDRKQTGSAAGMETGITRPEYRSSDHDAWHFQLYHEFYQQRGADYL